MLPCKNEIFSLNSVSSTFSCSKCHTLEGVPINRIDTRKMRLWTDGSSNAMDHSFRVPQAGFTLIPLSIGRRPLQGTDMGVGGIHQSFLMLHCLALRYFLLFLRNSISLGVAVQQAVLYCLLLSYCEIL